MNPEISRRCASCGASIRERDALFCPECGKAVSRLSAPASNREPPSFDRPTEKTERSVQVAEDGSGPGADRFEGQESDSGAGPGIKAPTAEAAVVNQPRVSEPAPHKRNPSEQRSPSHAHPRMERTRETLHRAGTVARGVIEDEVKRVERIRHVSSVVIEEASYDPSLRFVLVALGLFILFLILLVVTKLMG
jgi:zinc-ribbon domain